MSLKIIKLENAVARAILVAAAILWLAGSFYFGKWALASAVSIRADTKEAAELIIQMAPDDPQTHYATALAYDKTFDIADLARSLNEYEIATALSPNNYFLWLDLGRARERNGDPAGAENALRRALELAPNYAAVQWAYGNTLVRHGKTAEGFAQIAKAAAADPKYSGPAATTAWAIFDGDVELIRRSLGDSPETNAGLAVILIGQKRYDDAFETWSRLPAETKKVTYKEIGDSLIEKFVGAKKYRLAASVSGDLGETEERPAVGQVGNGGFEKGVKQRYAGPFEWQIAEGGEPQIGLSEAQKHGGNYALSLVFHTMQASDFRQVSQTVVVEPGAAYEFEGYYRSDLKTSVSLKWEVLDTTDGKSLGKTESIVNAANWTSLKVRFSVPPGSDAVTIRLIRAEGCNSPICPIEGKIWFDDIELRRL